MKKFLFALMELFLVLIMVSCQAGRDESISQNPERINSSQIVSVEDDSAAWSRDLQTTGMLAADLDGDGVEDTVQIEYTELEGTPYITRFEIILSNSASGFLISETYDASFEKMEMADIDQDTKEEMFLLFDSHGAGGQGTHDLYVLWLKEDGVVARMMDTIDAISVAMEPDWMVDSIYDIEKIDRNGDQKLLVRQYMWDCEGGHSSRVGDLVSIVSFDSESGLFKAEESWIEQ